MPLLATLATDQQDDRAASDLDIGAVKAAQRLPDT
jgi:hypothetical protein